MPDPVDTSARMDPDASGAEQAATATRVLGLTCDISKNHPRTRYFDRFRRHLAQRSGGRLACRINPGGYVHPGIEAIEATLLGEADLGCVNSGILEHVDPGFAVLNLPFAISDTVLSSADARRHALDAVNEIAGDSGWQVLSLMRGTDAIFVFPDRERRTPAEFAGRTVRVASPGMNEAVVRALGAEPVIIPIPALQSAFANGAVTGVMTSPGAWSSQLGMAAPHALHVPGLLLVVYAMIARKAVIGDLAGADRAALQEAADEAILDRWTDMARDDSNLLSDMVAKGATLTRIDDVAPWRDSLRPTTLRFAQAHRDIWDRFQPLMGNGAS